MRAQGHWGLLIWRLACLLGVGAAHGPHGAYAQPASSPNPGEANSSNAQPGLTNPAPTYVRDVLPILMGKCSRCHNEQSSVPYNWFDYKTAVRDRTEIKRRVWQSWKGTYYKQPMPAGAGPEAFTITEEQRALIKDWAERGAPYGSLAAGVHARSKGERITLGQRLFGTICSACHQPNGMGIPSRFPPLAGSDFLNADKGRAIRVVLNGLQGEVTVNGHTFNNSMPRFPLNDEDIANALTYVYNSFGNSGQEVTPEEVSGVRQHKEEGYSAGRSPTPDSEEKSPFE